MEEYVGPFFSRNFEYERTSGDNFWGFTTYTDHSLRSHRIISLRPKGCLKHSFSEKKAFSPTKKSIRPIILVLWSMKNFRKQFITVYKVFWQVLCKLWDHFFGTCDVDDNSFSEKGYFLDKKKLISFFSYYRVWQTPGNKLFGSTWFSGSQCPS